MASSTLRNRRLSSADGRGRAGAASCPITSANYGSASTELSRRPCIPRLRRVLPYESERVLAKKKRGGACSGHRLDREGHRVTRLWFIRAALRPFPPLGGQPLR